MPNVILSSDYLISVSPLKVIGNQPHMSIMNLLNALPAAKYGEPGKNYQALYSLGIDRVLSDLYFTLPFDLGIIEARQKYTSLEDGAKGKTEELGKIIVGDPFQADCEASKLLGLKAKYLDFIEEACQELQPKPG